MVAYPGLHLLDEVLGHVDVHPLEGVPDDVHLVAMVRQVKVSQLDVTHQPPRMRVDAELGGFRYVEDRDTVAVV